MSCFRLVSIPGGALPGCVEISFNLMALTLGCPHGPTLFGVAVSEIPHISRVLLTVHLLLRTAVVAAAVIKAPEVVRLRYE